ncbi:MAG: hypothetical protein VZS12_10760, partial [Ruminococcus bromii]|nr:hypothetical protein [Ruminococcus bromii]
METIMIAIGAAALAVAVITLIIVLTKNNNKNDNTETIISAVRHEMTSQQSVLRQELSAQTQTS